MLNQRCPDPRDVLDTSELPSVLLTVDVSDADFLSLRRIHNTYPGFKSSLQGRLISNYLYLFILFSRASSSMFALHPYPLNTCWIMPYLCHLCIFSFVVMLCLAHCSIDIYAVTRAGLPSFHMPFPLIHEYCCLARSADFDVNRAICRSMSLH